ncbi:MAG: hypothetical protein HY898_05460 [Deltaproteobacteria bacterium]|nr:hypothetical protein [Deltaproteobacteria bacterium]
MTRTPVTTMLAAAVSLAACGSDQGTGTTPGSSDGTISGSVQGAGWTSLQSALWISKAGAPTAVVFLFEAKAACADISAPNWDKNLGASKLLEIQTVDSAPRTYSVSNDPDSGARTATVAYLYGNYNPNADSGSVTIESVIPGRSLSGSFDVGFGTDGLKGAFKAAYCAGGVEP